MVGDDLVWSWVMRVLVSEMVPIMLPFVIQFLADRNRLFILNGVVAEKMYFFVLVCDMEKMSSSINPIRPKNTKIWRERS